MHAVHRAPKYWGEFLCKFVGYYYHNYEETSSNCPMIYHLVIFCTGTYATNLSYCGLGPLLLPWLNSLAPGRFEWHFRWVIFMLILVIDDWCISCEIAIRWMQLDFTDDRSTLFQVMAWCHQATSHYLRQCWPRSMSPYGVIRPQWVKFNLSMEK